MCPWISSWLGGGSTGGAHSDGKRDTGSDHMRDAEEANSAFSARNIDGLYRKHAPAGYILKINLG